MTMSVELLSLIERKSGKSIETLQSETLSEHRSEAEAKHCEPMRMSRLFPFVGRGSVMGDFLLSHSEINKQLDHAIR